tara:strand:- start:187 stop:357 length:171 start_codon:yes stop_codon:yes gene_type:complete
MNYLDVINPTIRDQALLPLSLKHIVLKAEDSKISFIALTGVSAVLNAAAANTALVA